jgi:hypothetical protein
LAIKATLRARRRRRRILWISVVVIIVATLTAAYFISAATGDVNAKYIGQPVSSSIMKLITGVSDSTLSAVSSPTGVTPPVKISGSTLTSGGKPEFLYIGGDFCPYCAIERWSIIIALSHFGTFQGLEYTQSSSTDINPNTPTFTFSNVTYTSNYIAFVGVEEFGRGGTGDVRQALTADQSTLVSQYDTCAGTNQSGGIPFLDIANAYAINCGAQFQLPNIAGENWTQVASLLNTPSSNVAQLIDGAANSLITAICKVDGSQPSSVCSQPYATVTLSYAPPSAGTSQTNLLTVPAGLIKPKWIV